MLEFLLDNPIVLFFVLFALSRVLRRKKGSAVATPNAPTESKAAIEARRRAAARGSVPATAAEPAATGPAVSLADRLEQLARDWQGRIEGTAVPQVRTAPGEPLAAAGAPTRTGLDALRPASLEAASLERGSREATTLEGLSLDRGSIESGSLEKSGPIESVDLDIRSGAFVYHSAIEEPETKAYHLDSFAGFHSASGTRTGGRAEGGALEEIDAAGVGLFATDEEVRRAFILSEVLGRPRALRPLRSR